MLALNLYLELLQVDEDRLKCLQVGPEGDPVPLANLKLPLCLVNSVILCGDFLKELCGFLKAQLDQVILLLQYQGLHGPLHAMLEEPAAQVLVSGVRAIRVLGVNFALFSVL